MALFSQASKRDIGCYSRSLVPSGSPAWLFTCKGTFTEHFKHSRKKGETEDFTVFY